MPKNIVLLGPPGAGKGTQAVFISQKYSIPHISTGDILRSAASSGTKLGLEAAKYMNAGKLVPDELVIGLMKERLSQTDAKNGYLLDGFPRTLNQAEKLDSITKVTAVIQIDVPDDVLIKRLTGRRTCACGAVFHVYANPPKIDGICDTCGGKLFQRSDDSEEVIKKRLETYSLQTRPLIEYYSEKNLLKKVDGTKAIQTIQEDIGRILD